MTKSLAGIGFVSVARPARRAPSPAPEATAGELPAVPGYRVLCEIARGGMGRVLGAFDLTLERDGA
jgi:hypothetical protein